MIPSLDELIVYFGKPQVARRVHKTMKAREYRGAPVGDVTEFRKSDGAVKKKKKKSSSSVKTRKSYGFLF